MSAAFKKTKMGGMSEVGTIVELLPRYKRFFRENKMFYQYTPSGKIELGTVNEEEASQFEIGKEYYVDFTP